jgi:hypothetical protein
MIDFDAPMQTYLPAVISHTVPLFLTMLFKISHEFAQADLINQQLDRSENKSEVNVSR